MDGFNFFHGLVIVLTIAFCRWVAHSCTNLLLLRPCNRGSFRGALLALWSDVCVFFVEATRAAKVPLTYSVSECAIDIAFTRNTSGSHLPTDSDPIHQNAVRSGRIEALRRAPDIKNRTTQVSASEKFESSVWEDYRWRFERNRNHAIFVLRTRRILVSARAMRPPDHSTPSVCLTLSAAEESPIGKHLHLFKGTNVCRHTPLFVFIR